MSSGERTSRAAGRIALAGFCLAISATAALADYREDYDDWWLECRSKLSEPGNYSCAAQTAPQDGVAVFVVQRAGTSYLVAQAEPGIRFDRSLDVSFRINEGVRLFTLPQQPRVAYVAGPEVDSFIAEAPADATLHLSFRDDLGATRYIRFPVRGLRPAVVGLTSAMTQFERSGALPEPAARAQPSSAGTEDSSFTQRIGDWFRRNLSSD
ncbi:hypothetical protein [Oceanibacterium hippocampi]|uniref:Invasion associated locus B (IalB) protein n=1 Tax=Oceanibacterium hippocampi TaxID=745714 RepID=A0A1Y5S8K4_9PROT|nr:hypothetical protein [Oceanibacterium hippocampi]SLN34592.1 hypothetical protein OCH7691_01346 [Oceanibacterium hippocampi]